MARFGAKKSHATLPVSWAARGVYGANLSSCIEIRSGDRENARSLRKIVLWAIAHYTKSVENVSSLNRYPYA